METRACQGCGEPINLLRGHAKTCSSRCRVRVHRMRRKAAETSSRIYKERRWVRADGKRPLQLSGRFASVVEPQTRSEERRVGREGRAGGWRGRERTEGRM